MSKVFRNFCLGILLSYSGLLTCYGQNFHKYEAIAHPDHVLFVVSELPDTLLCSWIKDAEDKLQQEHWQLNVFHAAGKNPVEVKEYLNAKFNNPVQSNLTHSYLVFIGSRNLIEAQKDLYKTPLFVRTAELYTDQKPGGCTNCYSWGEQPLKPLLEAFAGNFLWEIDLAEARKAALESNKTKGEERAIGFFINQSFNHGQHTGYIPPNMTSYGLRFGKHFRPEWRWNVEAEFGYSMPDIESVFQQQIQSQVDVSALQSGINQDIEINASLQGYFYGAIGGNVQYVFYKPGRSWSPYVAMGFSLMGQLGFENQIDTTITVDASTFPGSGGGLGGQAPDRSALSGSSPSPVFASRMPLSAGWQVYFNERLSLDISLNYTFDMARLQGAVSNVNAIQLRFGLAYHFWPKRKKFYRYLR